MQILYIVHAFGYDVDLNLYYYLYTNRKVSRDGNKNIQRESEYIFKV